MPNNRFLLIKAYGWGFWADMDHLFGQLLAAELTNRIPIIYWGVNSLYSDTINTNAFELYYQPVSPYSIKDVVKPEYTYYPPVWNYKNVLVEDLDKTTAVYRNLGDMMSSNADVVVSDNHCFARPILEYIKKGHWTYGLTPLQIFRRLHDKYLHLQPDIQAEIDGFYNENLCPNQPVLGVHVRGTDKIIEVANLSALNKRYHQQIKYYLETYGAKKIFLITDSKEILDNYKRKYGSLIVSTECNRSVDNTADKAPQLDNFKNRRRKGIEILKDTYLAAKCDFFIGNGYSNVSFSVKRLKDWPEPHITLFYNTLKEEKKLAKKRTNVELIRKRNRAIEHRLNYPELHGGI